MVMLTLFPVDKTGTSKEGKAFDLPGYENALKESGWTGEDAAKYWSDLSNTDPYAKTGKDLDSVVNSQAPVVSVQDGKINIAAPQTVLDSALVAQIKDQVQTLKGMDLSSAEVANAISVLNDEIKNSIRDGLIEDTFGWTKEEFEDYQRVIQAVNVPNPMSSKDLIKGYDRYGDIQKMTPKQWEDYYREAYNTDDRTDAFLESLNSDSPYGRTMALVLSKGSENPIYGWDTWERIKQGFAMGGYQWKMLPKGMGQWLDELFLSGGDARRVDSIAAKLNVAMEDIIPDSLSTDENIEISKYNKLKEEISGKSWDELDGEQKGFLIKVAVSREPKVSSVEEREMYGHGGVFDDTANMSSDDAGKSRESIQRILEDSNYDRYKEVWTAYAKLAYADMMDQQEVNRLAKNALWSASEQRIGAMGGTLARFLTENALVKGLTGFSMNNVSEVLGDKLLSAASKIGLSASSAFGQAALTFATRLIGAFPEDVLQNAVDNLITYQPEENANLLSGEEISNSFKNNLIFMGIVSGIRAGWSSIKLAQTIKKLQKQLDLDTPIDIEGLGSETIDAVKVYDEGGHLETDGQRVFKVNADGTKEELSNVTPEQAKMLDKVVSNGGSSVAPWDAKANSDWNSGTKMARGYIAAHSPIDMGDSTNSGSVAGWIHSAWTSPDADAEIAARWEALPEEVRNKILENKSFRERVERQGLTTVFSRLGVDNVYDADLIDRAYADYLWKQQGAIGAGNVGSKASESGTGERVAIETPDFDDAARAAREAGSAVDDAGKSADNGTVRVEVDTPDGRQTVEVQDYNFKSDAPEDVLDASIKVEPTKAGVTHWYNKVLNALMRFARSNTIKEFRARFGDDITTDDFDWVLYNTKRGMTPDQIVGTTIEGTNRVITQNTIDALKWWAEQPINKLLRQMSLKSLGKDVEDYNLLGYLPHTNYDPWVVPFEEGKAGQLWQQFTGKSMMKDGKYIGYGGTLEGRLRTFISNMLWDIKGQEISAAKLIEDAALDGKQLAPDEAMKMAKGWQEIDSGVTSPKKSKSMDNAVKGMTADGDGGADDFKKADEAFRNEAPNCGVTKSMNKNFSEMYFGSGTKNVEQPKRLGKATFAVGTQGDTMRKIKVDGVSMYDAGAADITYAPQNAAELVNRWIMDGADPKQFRSYLAEYIKVHSKRSPKYVEPVVDRIMERIARENSNGLTKGGVIKTLTKSFRSEGYNRLRRWTTLADYSQFDEGTIKFMDSFWYRHMQQDALTTNKDIISKVANFMTELRYDALFYGNFKNALLQVSELNRLATVFKWRDIGSMIKRLATDADYRAKVDMYYDAVAPKTSYLDAGLYEKYGNVNDAMEVGETQTTFGKIKDAKDTIDKIALAPIEAAEAFKNKTIVAALVAEADRLEAAGKITGANEKLMWIRQRFERVALAQNEMGKIGLSTNPVAKPFLFLQNFQIRELGMNHYNIWDPVDLDEGTVMKKGKWLNAAKYFTKVFGAKLGTTLILARLGYSASQTMGFDPLGLVGNYDRLSDDEKTWIDEQISGGILTPFFAGGMTSLFADMYFMAREAYEEANRESIEDEAGANLDKGQNPFDRFDWSVLFSWDNLRDSVADFAPGSVFANRIGQMNEMMDSGWAVSNTGNQMYTAPNDAFNTALGYLFGRSATQNAQDYRQTYGEDLGQTLGRIWRGVTGSGTTFDPIDTKNYSDWFDGSENDTQQFEKGKRWFIDERDRILDEYQKQLQSDKKYGDIYETEAKNSMMARLEDLFTQLGRFVAAYEKQHGTISGKMVKELIGVLNIERESVNDTADETNESGRGEYSKAMERYAQYGLPAVGYYAGPTEDYPGTSVDESKTEVKYKGSPQWQVSSTSGYTLQSELAAVLRAGDAVLEDFRKELKTLYGEAVQNNDYTEFNKAQEEYLKAFDSVVGPIIATYGIGTINSKEVKAQLEDMLSTSSNSGKNIGNLIPYKQYATDKYGRVRNVPNESVNVIKWALQRYSGDAFKHPTIRSYSTAQEDIDTIKRLANNGQNDMARARALVLKVRVDNQKRALSKTDYQWLLNFLNNGGI